MFHQSYKPILLGEWADPALAQVRMFRIWHGGEMKIITTRTPLPHFKYTQPPRVIRLHRDDLFAGQCRGGCSAAHDHNQLLGISR
jgi:hypothetical protein